MPDLVPLFGPCRLLHILGQKNPPQREENPIRVFHASRLLHACEQVSYRPLLSPVSSLPLDPLLPKVILPQDNCRALYLYIALASEVLVRLPLSKHSRFTPLQHDSSPKAQRGVLYHLYGCPFFRDPTSEPWEPNPQRT